MLTRFIEVCIIVLALSGTSQILAQNQIPLEVNNDLIYWYRSQSNDSVSLLILKPDLVFDDAGKLFAQIDSSKNRDSTDWKYQNYNSFFNPREERLFLEIAPGTKIFYGFPIDHYAISSHVSESFNFKIYPVYGLEISDLKKSGNGIFGFQKHNYQGFTLTGNFRNGFSFFVTAVDHQAKLNFNPETYRTTLQGYGFVKRDKPFTVDFNEINTELSLPLLSGNLAVGKSNPNWSINNESTVLSEHVVSFPNVRWKIHFDDQFYYETLWGELTDFKPQDADTLTEKKHIAAHRFVFRPNSRFSFSIFESIIYYKTSFEPVYHIPFVFMRAAEHFNGSPDNANLGISIEFAPNNNWYFGYQFLIDDISTNIAFSDSTNNKLANLLGVSYTDKFFGKYFQVKLTGAYVTSKTYFHRNLATQYYHYGDALGLDVYRDRLNFRIGAEYNLIKWVSVAGELNNWKQKPKYYYSGTDYFQNNYNGLNHEFSLKINPVLPFTLEYKLISFAKVSSQFLSVRYGIQ